MAPNTRLEYNAKGRLVDDKTRNHGRVPQNQYETLREICRRVCGTAKYESTRYHRPNDTDCTML